MKADPPTNVTRSTLSNSFKVITNHNPVAEKTTVCLWIKSGSSHEPLEQNGLSHLLEHTLFGQRYGDQKSLIYEAITSKGLKIRAFTTTEDTAYLIDNVIIRPANDKFLKDKGVIWESLWAALTFGVIKANGL